MDDAFDDPENAPKYPHRARDAEWVEQARSGSDRAFGQLYDAWFDRVFDLTSRIVRNRDAALEVTQDAFLSAWRSLDSLADPGAFGGWLLRIARNGALNRQQKELRSVPLDDQDFAVMEAVGGSASNAPTGFTFEDRLASETDPERALENAETRDLVWQAASALGERDTEVLNLQLRHGLSPAEIGDVLGMNRNAANQLVHRVRGRFEVALRARLLWRNEKPACKELRRLLASAGVDGFSVEAVKIADKHAPSCPECTDRRKSALTPAAMFGAIPVMAAPIVFKQQAAYALESAGVPMGGSAFGSGGDLASSVPTDGDGASGDGNGSGGDGGSSASSAGSAAASSAGKHVGRRMLVMAGVAVVVCVGLIAVVSGKLSDPASNEVVALASGSPGTKPKTPDTAAGQGQPGTSTVDETPSGNAIVPFDPGSPNPGDTTPTSGVVSPPTSTGGIKPNVPGPTITLPDGGPVDPGPGPTQPGPTVSVINGPPPVTDVTQPPVQPPPSVKAEIGVDPANAPARFQLNPPIPGKTVIVSWSVTGSGIVGVKVSGAGMTASSAFTGSVAVCPTGQVRGNDCVTTAAARRTFTYTLEVYGSNSVVLARKTATVTM